LHQLPLVQDVTSDEKFTQILAELVDSHADVIPVLARGIQECRRYLSKEEITDFLNRTIQARIGIRVLAEHHLALHRKDDDQHPYRTGIVDQRLSPFAILKRAAPYAQELCELNFGTYPEFIINGQTDTTFPYIDVHLDYMLFELLKNAFRATAEHCRKIGVDDPPPVEITIARGDQDVTIRIRDQGGGISEEKLQQVWEYSYTTVDDDADVGNQTGSYDGIFATAAKMAVITGTGGQMAGLGYGLPMTRIYAQWAGGSLDLISLYEHGCDVFLRLPHIGNVETMQI
jgi:signal transduction histidine kinase